MKILLAMVQRLQHAWDQALIDNKTRHGQLRSSPYGTYVSAHVHVGLLPHHCLVERLVCSWQIYMSMDTL
jgi:hypothetical protein